MIAAAGAWLALVLSLPTSNATARMRIWRALKALGCGALRDGVYLLPDGAASLQALAELARTAQQSGGGAQVLRVSSVDAQQDAALRALFERGEQYRELVAAAKTAAGDAAHPAKALRTLRRDFDAIAAIDFFPGEAQAQARQALADLEAALSPGEPRAAAGRIRRLAAADYQGRTWATRRHLWVDRMASAWLIRRFIDRKARFVWLDKPEHCPRRALGFDFDGAAFTHVAGRVTFEVLAASFGLDADPALRRIGDIVHFLDAGGIAVDTAPGVEAILAGARSRADDDDALLDAAGRIFDFLYAAQKETTE
jgi:hypothetical protein